MSRKNNINRREFLKILGGATAVATGVGLTSCNRSGITRREARLTGRITGEMTYRINSKNGDRIGLLGYGAMRWRFRVNADGQEEPDQDDINRLVDVAMEHGVNFYDTAPGYMRGLSEEAMGIALKRHPRDKYFIATKLSNFDPRTHSFEASKAMYERSFTRMQVDVIDYYLLHAVGTLEAYKARYIDNGILDFLKEEKEKGRITNLGWSFHGTQEFFDYMLELYDTGEFKWEFMMIQHNFVDYRHASGHNINSEYLSTELAKRNIPALIMEPLFGGRLASLNPPLEARLRQREPEASIASWAFRFAAHYENVFTVLSGMTYMEHLLDNLATFSPLIPLEEDEYALMLDTAVMMQEFPTIPCTVCQYCMPCRFGVDIPSILMFYNRFVNDASLPRSSQDPDFRAARRRFLIGYDRNVERLRQAKHCINCGECNQKCPQRIDIPHELIRINNFVEQLRQGTI